MNEPVAGAVRNITLYPWMKFFQNLIFYQAIWFLFFQTELSASEAILLYAVYDLSTFALEVPSGYMSDRLGRRITLIAAAVSGVVAGALLTLGDGFLVFAIAQAFLGAASAFASGTDSSLLYESLLEEGREDEVEAQEVRAWRFTFAALAVSAVTGGALSLFDFTLAFAGTGLTFTAMLVVVLMLSEPRRQDADETEWERFAALRRSFTKPVLIWLFALGVLMYAFSHVPFVFGQPFIQSALSEIGWSDEAPLVSGAVTSIMMLLSVASSWVAPVLRRHLGLGVLLMLAFAMQIGIAGGLAFATSVAAIPILFLRMVPDAFSQAFIRARVQPELESGSRATWLSIKSLAGRIFFSGTLFLAAMVTSERSEMSFDELQLVLGAYAVTGLVALIVLVVCARGIAIERPQNH